MDDQTAISKREELTIRRNMYWLFSQVFSREVSELLLESLEQDVWKDFFDSLTCSLDLPRENDRAQWLEETSVEYARLFLGPGKHISPYIGPWLGNSASLWGEEVAELLAYLRAMGLNIADSWNGLPSHFCVVLEMIGQLIDHELEQDHLDESFDKIQYELLEKFIWPWIEDWQEALVEQGANHFYENFSSLLCEFLLSEKEYLQGSLEA